MKVYLSRWVCLDVENNMRRLEEESRRAVAAEADMVLFPELFLTGYRRELDLFDFRTLCGHISGSAADTLFLFGTVSEGDHNRAVVWHDGHEVARYDKVHLFRPNDEHSIWKPGDRYVAVRWRDHTVGLVVCNDIRFPEQARALCLRAQCDILAVVAWWPWRRDHIWRALLQARAAENGVWVIGCCIAGSIYPGEEFAGAGNYAFDPCGEPVTTADDRTYLLNMESTSPPVVDSRNEWVKIDRIQVLGDE